MITTILSFFIYCLSLQAQSNILKYRIFALPFPLPSYATAIGYEKNISDKDWIQFLIEANGYRAFADGPTEHTILGLVEIKRHFGKNKDNTRKTAYASTFLEVGNTNVIINYIDFSEDLALTRIKRRMLNLGIGIGKHAKIGKKTCLDLYVGGKYKLVLEKDFFQTLDGKMILAKSYPHRLGVRIGFTIGYILNSDN
ncbi:MAG: hypothetical protein AAGG68_19025 [Bacteroidota bacterium]